MSKLEAADPLDETAAPKLTDRLAQSQTYTPSKTARTVPAREAQMAALRRILGDSVLDIFPADFTKAVDDAYKFWEETPDSYLITDYDTEQDKNDSLTVMRAYAECADNGGYTIRTLADEDPRRLVWRAQTRRKVRNDG